VVWAGLGRLPRRAETPTIVVEFVSRRERDQRRGYLVKREEYLGFGVKEYWIIDRFSHTMTVMSRAGQEPVARAQGRPRLSHPFAPRL
jgi:Uma2 family endonuclease